MNTSSITRRLVVCAIYAIAMAYVESAVVVYLRELLDGSTHLFPLVPFPPKLFRAEFAREIATIVMLAAVAAMQSRRPRVFLAFFIYCFGIWDIFYYVWLKVLIGWPTGLLTWDILFLIPLPWFAPVLSPTIVSLLFVAAALVILRFEAAGKPLRFARVDWLLATVGALIIVGSYLWELPTVARTGHPDYYPWWLFAIGIAVWVATFARRVIVAK